MNIFSIYVKNVLEEVHFMELMCKQSLMFLSADFIFSIHGCMCTLLYAHTNMHICTHSILSHQTE